MLASLLALVLTVAPHVAFAPAFFRIRVQADEGVTVGVTIDGRTSEEPRRDIRTHYFEWKDIPAGEYEVVAYSADARGNVLHIERTTVVVKPQFGESQ